MKKHLMLVMASLTAPLWAQVGQIEEGQKAAAVCVACHMAQGEGKDNGTVESWPRLAGLSADYIVKQLQDMKNGTRQAPSMLAFVNMLSEQQMLDIAAYYASLPVAETAELAPVDEALLAHGEKLALRGDWDRYIPPCMSCHGADNTGVGKHFPNIAGQHAGYLRKQLQLWQEDKRQNDVNQLMQVVAKRLTAEDIEAVSQWLARQNGQGAQK